MSRKSRIPAAMLATSFVVAGAAAAAAGESETRAVWITRWDYRTEEGVRTLVRRAAEAGFDTLLFQVRGQADAYYRSELEPWPEELAGKDPGFDPLAVATDEAKQHGVGIHAWLNAIPAWKGTTPPRSPEHIYHRHPEWLAVDREGRPQPLNDHYVTLSPLVPEARAHVVAVARDVAARYEVAGIHLDYIRTLGREYSYRRGSQGSPDGEDAEAHAERCRQAVTGLVRDIAKAVHEARPKARMSAAVLRHPVRARAEFAQDWPAWVREGLVDLVYPMDYRKTLEPFVADLEAALAECPADRLVPGVGAFQHADPATTLAQIEALRARSARGFGIFCAASLWPTEDPKGSRFEAKDGDRARLLEALRAGPLARR